MKHLCARRVSAALSLLYLAGCQSVPAVPPGTNIQVSAVGLDISPMGQAGAATIYPSVTLGFKTAIISTPPPADCGAGVNRCSVRAPFTDVTSTVASSPGELGDQLAKSAAALAVLHGMDASAIPVPLSPAPAPPQPGARTPAIHLPPGEPFMVVPLPDNPPSTEQPLNLPPAAPSKDPPPGA